MATNVYEDERYIANEAEKQQALTENEQTYAGMANNVDKVYQEQMDAVDQNAETQKQIQQEQTDFALEQIEQQKEQTQKDYIKEQKGAYTDWKKQSNEYGAQAEQMAAQGLAQTGFSESSNVSMWNTYQNRVATARESLGKAELEYNNMMKGAILQNSSALAEIAANAYAQKAALALEAFGYRNDLLTQKMDRDMQIQSMYESKGQSIIDQINYEEQMAYQAEQDRIANERYERELRIQEQKATAELEMYDMYATDDTEEEVSGSASSASDTYTATKYKIPYTVSNGMKNSKETQNRKDYYFSNGYQPRYINDSKVTSVTSPTSGKKLTVGEVFGDGLGVKESQTIWATGDGKYWVWRGSDQCYMSVTNLVNEWLSYFE